MASEIKVNTIKKASGSSIAVGESGDTITINSGATITTTGTVSGNFKDIQWQSVVTADGSTNTTAEAGKGYFIDTTSATHTITLPASPSVGDTVGISDVAGTFATNNCTVGRNSEKINGSASDDTLSNNDSQRTYVYSGSTYGWQDINSDNVTPVFITATGGTTSTSGDYKIHTFNSSGCFVVSCVGNQPADTVNYLVIAGGGGGGRGNGGGGGAGGHRTNYPSPDTGGLSISATTYPITVGAGGAGRTGSGGRGVSGSNSIFSTITSAAGGGGGANDTPGNGFDGGSGGGGGNPNFNGGSGNTPPVSPSQGNNGGNATASSPAAAGGGGAGGVGGNTPGPTTSGAGGAGTANSITGSSVTRAGGGSGGVDAGGTSGSVSGGGGAGANGCSAAGSNGTANTGGGAGGGGGGGGNGGTGGSGVVIIRYKYQ